MSDLAVKGEVVFDASKAESAFDRLGDKAEKMAGNVGAAAGKAGAAVDGIGTGAEKGVEKFTRAESRMIDSIKRTTTELNLLGKTASEKLEFKINDKGLDVTKFQAYIAELKKAEAAQIAMGASASNAGVVATNSLNSMGMSTKALNAAMRGVPAQFTDIVVSLQGGQKPLTVLLQQGGQLKDMFGGIGNAVKALGTYISGLINPFTLAAAAAAGVAYAYYSGAQEARAYTTALILSGNAAGTTKDQLTDMARAMSQLSGTQGKAAEGLAVFAQSGAVGAENLQKFTTAAIDFEKATGTAVDKTVEKFAELKKAPLEASLKLNETMGYLTVSLYDQIKALEDQGRATEAANLAQNAYANTIESRANDIRNSLGLLEKSWSNVAGAAKWAWDKMLNIGRDNSLTQQIESARKLLDGMQPKEGIGARYSQDDIDAQKKLIDNLEKLAGSEKASADYRAKEVQLAKDTAEFDKSAVKYVENKVKMQRELISLANEYSKVEFSPARAAAYATAVAKIQDQFKEKAAPKAKEIKSDPFESEALKQYVKVMDDLRKVQDSATEKALDLSKAQSALREIQASPVWAAYSRQQQEQIIYSASLAQSAEDLVSARKKAANMVKESAKAETEYNKSLEDSAKNSMKQAAESETALQNYGLLKSAIDAATLSKLQQNLAFAETPDEARSIAIQIESQKRIIAAGNGLAVKEEAKKAAGAWKATANTIRDSLTDAFMSAIDNGKSLFVNLRDSVVGMFKNMVLRPIVQASMSPIAGAVTSSLGLSGVSSAANAASSIGSVASVGSAFTGAFSAGASIGIDAFSAGATMMAEASGVSSFMAGAGQALGALGPVGWVALGLGALALGGNNTKSTAGTGEGSKTYNALGNVTGTTSKAEWGGLAPVDASITNMAASYFASAASLGIKAAGVQFSQGSNTGKQGENPNFAIGSSINGNNAFSSGETPLSDAAYQLAASRAVFAALQASELPKYLAGVFDDITASTATTDQITASLAGAQALATFHTALQSLPFDSLKDLTYAATQSLIGFSGSLENLQTNLGGFYANFYTSAEKTAQLTTNTATAFDKLGITMPAIGESTRDWYKELVLSQMALDQSVPANAAATAGVLSLQGAVNELAPAFVDAASAAAQALQKIRTAVDAAVSLQVQLGTKTELSVVQDTAMRAWAALQAAIPGSGRFTEADIAAYAANPLNQSPKTNDVGLTQAQIDAMNTFVTASSTYHSYMDSHAVVPTEPTAAAAAVDPNIATRLQLERQILELNKDTVALRLLDIAGMDKYNVGLYDQITAIKDTQTALATAAASSAATANERKGLQDQLNTLTDTNAQALARQRDALDESNRALFDNIQAIKAVQAAYATSKTGTDTALNGVKTAVAKEKERIQGLIDAAASRSDSAKKATDDALAALNRVIDAEKTRIGVIRDSASESVSAIKGVFDLLKDQVKQLYAETDATLGMQADQGNAFIAQALQTALSTGYLPDQTQLADAIAGARGGLDKNNYATAFEYDKATLTLAGKLSQLRDIAGPQLTSAQSALKAAEDQLKALDAQAALAKTQIDTLRGIDTSVLSVSDAVAALQTRMASEASTAAASGAVDTQALKDQLTALDATLDLAQKQYDAINGIDSSVKSVADAVNALAAAMGKQASSGAANLYASNASAIAKPDATGLQYWGDQITANGYDATKPIFDATVTSINDTVKGWYANNPDATKTPDAAGIQYWLQQIADTGEMSAKQNFANVVASITNKPVRPISSFKVGTNYTQEGLAYLHEGEAVVPRAYNPAAGGSGNTERLERLVEGLTAEVQRLQAVVATGNRHAERTATVLDDAARGKQPLSTAA